MDHLLTIAISIAGPTILGTFGFLWRTHAKLTALEKTIEAHDRRLNTLNHNLTKHFDRAYTIRKNSE